MVRCACGRMWPAAHSVRRQAPADAHNGWAAPAATAELMVNLLHECGVLTCELTLLWSLGGVGALNSGCGEAAAEGCDAARRRNRPNARIEAVSATRTPVAFGAISAHTAAFTGF